MSPAMDDQGGAGLGDSLARLPQRVGSLIELLTTLDTRVLGALDALDNMQRSVTAFDPVSEEADQLVADARLRLASLDDRLRKDMDELKAALLAKLDELDVTSLGPRLDRLERAVFNIEKATIGMNRTLEGSVEALPGFMTRKIKEDGRRKSPDPAGEGPTRQ